MYDRRAGPGEDFAERTDVHGQRVHQHDVVRPGELEEGQLGEVGRLAMELGVEPDDRLVVELIEDVGEVAVVGDRVRAQADPAPRSTG